MIYFDSRRLINDGGEGTAAGTGSLSHTQSRERKQEVGAGLQSL